MDFISIISPRLLAGIAGALAGVQGVYTAYPSYALRATFKTFWGWVYILTRGIFPVILYSLADQYNSLFLSSGSTSEIGLKAFAFGLACEVTLRTKFYITTTKAEKPADISQVITNPNDPPTPEEKEDILKGPFDLILWYQNIFLDRVMISVMRHRSKLCNKKYGQFSKLNFGQLYEHFETKAGLLPKERQKTIHILKMFKEHHEIEGKEPEGPQKIDEKFKKRMIIGLSGHLTEESFLLICED